MDIAAWEREDEVGGPMKIMLPANYDIDLLPHLREHNVYEIYGKLPSDIVGGDVRPI